MAESKSNKKPSDKPATLKDVASLAGVSHSTVSRVLNHPELINEKTREKILKCIKELDYHPNPFGRGLQTSHSKTVALVVPNISNLTFANFTHGVQKFLEENEEQYGLIIFSSDENSQKEKFICNHLRQHWVDGVIFVSSAGGVPPTELLPDSMLKVLVERSNEKIDSLLHNLDDGILKACTYLHKLGHQDIAAIIGDTTSITSKERLKAFKRALLQLGLTYNETLVEEGHWTSRGGWKAMLKLLHLKKPPTAVFAITDTMAMGAIGAASHFGFKVPEDISVIGFNNEPGSAEFNPPLTTLDSSSFAMGKQAAEILLARIQDPDKPSVEIKYSLKLIKRHSTASPRVSKFLNESKESMT